MRARLQVPELSVLRLRVRRVLQSQPAIARLGALVKIINAYQRS